MLTATRLNDLGEVIHGLLDVIHRFRQANPPDARLSSNTEGLLTLDTTLQEMELAIPDTIVGKITVAHSQSISVNACTNVVDDCKNKAQGFTLAGFDSEGMPLAFQIMDGPKNGGIKGVGANRNYEPKPNTN